MKEFKKWSLDHRPIKIQNWIEDEKGVFKIYCVYEKLKQAVRKACGCKFK
jgi:hypothetical protein